MDRQAQVERLRQAERHITDAERNVIEQQLRIDVLRADGHDTRTAEQTLKGFEEILEVLREHREIIVKTIDQIDRGLA